ncbi:hypothetical protein JGU71_09545 [Antrihabitans sp. YC3-6]|uniref:Uncharacterized protein n=1 Tax=Antrihabitans stalagmiti TaxID=2799499 RepID=A0A934NPP4_9NOCA|nr:hypothetical protein [Antrihabitans stalagmiti]MBJ8339129.1 hypothetical protein [Antrihabitans stalagmiti]
MIALGFREQSHTLSAIDAPKVAYDLWATDPSVWVDVITRACRALIDTVDR